MDYFGFVESGLFADSDDCLCVLEYCVDLVLGVLCFFLGVLCFCGVW